MTTSNAFKVIYCPDRMYSGAKFGKLDFAETLSIGCWPIGMVIKERASGAIWRVIGSTKKRITDPECRLEILGKCCCNCHWQYKDLAVKHSWICLQPINPGEAVSGQKRHGYCGQWADWYKVQEGASCQENNHVALRQREDL